MGWGVSILEIGRPVYFLTGILELVANQRRFVSNQRWAKLALLMAFRFHYLIKKSRIVPILFSSR